MEELYNDIMTLQPRYKTFGEALFWTYATRQAIATAANSGEDTIGKKFYMFRQIYQYAVEHDLMAKDFEEVCQMSLPFNPHCLMILSNTQARQHYFRRAVREKENEDYGE